MSEGTKTVVRSEKSGHVATVWLCNPEKRNAMGPEFWEQLPQVMNSLSKDPEVRAAVIAAEGPAFTVGLDLKSMMGTLQPKPGMSQAQTRMLLLDEIDRLQGAISSVADFALPTVAAIHGWCIGGGVDLTSACDIRLASKDAKISVRETKIGIVADVGTLQRLPKIISKGHMAELAYTGKDIDASRAKEIGLVNDIYEDREAVIKAAHALAAEIADNSPLVLKGVKNVLAYGEDKSIRDGLKYVGVWNSAFVMSDDLGEAVMAFMQKRKPVYKGR